MTPSILRFSLREMFVIVALVSLHLAALSRLSHGGSSSGLKRIAALAFAVIVGTGFRWVLARRTSTFRAGLPFSHLASPQLRQIRLWQFAAVPLVALILASWFKGDSGEFPFVYVVLAVATVANALGLIQLHFHRTLSLCENGVEAEGRFVPWRLFEWQGWAIDERGLLTLCAGLGRYQAVVPPDRRAEVEDFLRRKLGEPRTS